MTHGLHIHISRKTLTQVITRKNQGAAGVLFLAKAVQVGRVTELGFYLFFAIAEIVIGNEGDNDACLVATSQFERPAVVVELTRFTPSHLVTALPFGGILPFRQAERFFGHTHEVRRENNAASVTG